MVSIHAHSSWQRLREVVIVVLAFTLVAFGTLLALTKAPVTHAAPSRPEIIGCTGNCAAQQVWGGTDGIQSTLYVLSGPDFFCADCDGTNTYIENAIVLDGDGAYGSMALGYRDPIYAGGGEYYFDQCFATVNGGCNFIHDLNPVNADKVYTTFTIENTNGGGRHYTFIAAAIANDYTTEGLAASEIYWLRIGQWYSAGHPQDIHAGRAYFTYNRWQNATSGQLQYQTNDGDGNYEGNPPWGGWENGQDPLHSSTGGDFWVECDEAVCSES